MHAAKVLAQQTNHNYRLHQLLWELFPNQQLTKQSSSPASNRTFLFREYQNEYREHCFYLLSATQPTKNHEALHVTTKLFTPKLHTGQRLMFELRANPVISRNEIEHGKRKTRHHDVLMNAKHVAKKHLTKQTPPLQPQQAKQYIQHAMQQAANDWLLNEKRMQSWGVQIETEPTISAYQQHRMSRKKTKDIIQISSIDYQGTLTITNAEAFTSRLKKGFGKAKAFGCGLMLIKPL